MGSNINILFYSNRCEPSKNLLSLMQSENLLRFFLMVCLDDPINAKRFPQIKNTPTLIIKDIPTPYVSGEAFLWFAKIKQWKTNMYLQMIANSQQEYLKYINKNLTQNNDILSFSEAEMTGMKDIFAYIKEDKSIPHTYFDYENIGKDKIYTPPLENGDFKVTNEKCKIDDKKTKELQNSLLKERKQQDEFFKQSFDNFRKNNGPSKN
jgi:hypothetical protein